MKARYEAAEASARVSEAMTGAGDEMENISRSIERAREDTEDMEARAAAMDELEESGAFESALSTESDLDRELDEIRQKGEVDAELETLKSEAGKGGTAEDDDVDIELEEDIDADVDLEEELDAGTDPDIESELDDIKRDDE